MIPIPESAGEALTNRSYAHRFFLQAIYLNFGCPQSLFGGDPSAPTRPSAILCLAVQNWKRRGGGTNRLRYLEVTVCRSEVEQAGDRNLGVCARGDMPVGVVANYQISRGTTPIRMSMKKAF